MKRLDIFLLWATVLYTTQEVCEGECVPETLSEVDAGFCHGGLEVLYPELKISECSIIPSRQDLRDKISRKWGPPRVRWTNAEEGKRYALIMVDPDAPSRCSPNRAPWRHWVVADIAGSDLKKGDVDGTVLSEYHPPTPPRKTSLHRYQFTVFLQQAKNTLSLTKEESSSRGNWDPQAFIKRFKLSPKAALQFLTQNSAD